MAGCLNSGLSPDPTNVKDMGVQTDSCNRNATAVQTEVSSQATALTETASVQTDSNSRKDFSIQTSCYSRRSTGTQAELPSRREIANQTTPPSDPQVAIQTGPSVRCGIKEEPPRGQNTNTFSVSNRGETAVQTDVRRKTSLLSRIKLALGIGKESEERKNIDVGTSSFSGEQGDTQASAPCTNSDTVCQTEGRRKISRSILSRLRQSFSRQRVSKGREDSRQQAVTRSEPPSVLSLETATPAAGDNTQKSHPTPDENIADGTEKYTAEQHARPTCSRPALTSGLDSSAALASLQELSGNIRPKTAFSKRGRGPTALEAERWRLLGDTSERLRRRRESLKRTLRGSMDLKNSLF